MDAHKLWMLRDFIGTNKVLFRIPVYQRNYDWSEANCDRLLDDIYEIINSGDKHFLGTIVFMAAKSGGFTLQEYTIIDGQQRLTTMMLILKALAVVAETVGDTCFQEIDEQYLHNKYCDEKYKVKLKPIKSDNNQFLLLLANKTDEMDEDTHIFQNYRLCKERFERWTEKGICPSQVLNALTKLEIVEIVLTKGEDDPQVIFESINSTGLDLSNADLIRNFLLMNADDQERLYEEYWLIIEKTLRNKMDYSNLDDFFMQYIVYKTGKPVNSRQLYHSFVKLFKGSNYTQEAILDELRYYAKIYGAFVYGNKDYSVRINQLLQRIRILKQTTCYPFLFHVFDDFHREVIDEETTERILQFILAYLLRRLVCGVPSNTLRGLFIYLYNRIFKVTANKRKYYESLNKFLCTVSSKDAVPSENEFERALLTANIYGNNALCRFLLLDIENGDNKETLQVENLTIEHIMPQTLSADWSYIDPEKHEESPNMEQDIYWLKKKIKAGAEYAVTQMFYDNRKYFEFVERVRKEGINVPIIPGIKPFRKLSQLNTIPKTFKIDLPQELASEAMKCQTDEEAESLGIEWCIHQCRELIACGVPSIHFYTVSAVNSVKEVAKAIY